MLAAMKRNLWRDLLEGPNQVAPPCLILLVKAAARKRLSRPVQSNHLSLTRIFWPLGSNATARKAGAFDARLSPLLAHIQRTAAKRRANESTSSADGRRAGKGLSPKIIPRLISKIHWPAGFDQKKSTRALGERTG